MLIVQIQMLEIITKAFSHFPFPIYWYMDHANHYSGIALTLWSLDWVLTFWKLGNLLKNVIILICLFAWMFMYLVNICLSYEGLPRWR